MSKHEIRLRKQRLTRGSECYRDFDALIERHQQGMRLKKLFNAMIIILALVIIIVLFIVVVYFEKKPSVKTSYVKSPVYINKLS